MKTAFQSLAQYPYRLGLGQTGRTFDQQVAVRQQRYQQPVYQGLLPQDMLFDLTLKV